MSFPTGPGRSPDEIGTDMPSMRSEETKLWVEVGSDRTGTTYRAAVPGGWLYRHNGGSGHNSSSAMTFVPSPDNPVSPQDATVLLTMLNTLMARKTSPAIHHVLAEYPEAVLNLSVDTVHRAVKALDALARTL